MKKYYLHNGTEQEGPFDIQELKNKNLNKETKVWFEGLSDWTTVGNVEELKELFKLTSPPPFKEKAKAAPPPINGQKTQKTSKKSPSWRSIFIKTGVTTLAIVGGIQLYKNFNSTRDYSYSTSSYEEKKMTVAEIEMSQPTKFLSADGTYRENLLGDKLKVNGTISNSATTVSYKDATVRVTYYSKTKTNLGSEDYTVWEVFPPNHTKTFNLKIKNYSNVNSIGWEVVDAEVY